jgi:hypothetical protein
MILVIFKYFYIFVFNISSLSFIYYAKEGRSTSKYCFLVQNILVASYFFACNSNYDYNLKYFARKTLFKKSFVLMIYNITHSFSFF